MFGHDERRRSQRLDMENELVNINWTNQDGQKFSRDVLCVDVSSRGLKVELMQALNEQQIVEIVFKANQEHRVTKKCSVIRCCMQSSGWFEVALAINEDTKEGS